VPRRLTDRLAVGLAWLSGLVLIGVVAGLLAWLGVNGLRNVDLDFVFSNPSPGSLEQGVAGGVFSPLVGTLVVIVLGVAVALPLGLGTAIFLVEYRRPLWLARVADTAIDLIFGVPSVVFALFGLAIFQNGFFSFLSGEVESSGKATAASFLCASLMMSLIALPPIVRGSQAAIAGVSTMQREAAYSLGKGRLATIRRVVLPAARPGVVTGAILGIGRIAGDTAIVWLLLGGSVLAPPEPGWWRPDQWLDTLRSDGSTLTTYVFYTSPVGEGNADSFAYGGAFVLMVLMLAVNFAVSRFARRQAWKTR
jgi:phosphate transport system permease protein